MSGESLDMASRCTVNGGWGDLQFGYNKIFSCHFFPGERLGVGEKCLTLKITKDETLIQPADCNLRFYSICCKLANRSVYPSSSFAINVKKTHKAVSKLTSAMDSRTLAKVLGGIGLLVIVILIMLVVATDIGNLYKVCRDKQFCKKNSRVQPLQIS